MSGPSPSSPVRRRLKIIFWLTMKELQSLRRDPLLAALIVYTFTLAIYAVAQGVVVDIRNAPVAIADEDGSALSKRIRGAFLAPYFEPPIMIPAAELGPAMNGERVLFTVHIPPSFETNALAGRSPAIQVNVDATAITLASAGASLIENIINRELAEYAGRQRIRAEAAVKVSVRARFNPTQEPVGFVAVTQLINNVTLISLFLSGAAVIREREHGTIEHLLVTPVRPADIMLAKVLANGVIVLTSVMLSLWAVLQGVMAVRIAGSLTLFAAGTGIFLFATTSLGVTLATLVKSMPQFGLLAIPFFVVMNLLSGCISPVEAMPQALQWAMQAAPSTPYTSFALAVLCRGAGLADVWLEMATTAAIGAALFAAALTRFRRTMATSG